MKNLKKFNKEKQKCKPVEIDEFTMAYSYEDCEKLIDLKFDDEQKYICFADYQGGEFAVDRILTAKGWALQALEWCDMDDHMPYITALINECDEEELLIEIADFWDIGIKPVI